jgi:Fe-S-cluster containining protein
MLFDLCKHCQKCCHVDEGFPPLEIPLVAAEKTCWQKLEISTACRFLGESGCTLGAAKPFACQQYPVSFDPKRRRFFFDADCPLYQQYQKDLLVESSEAHQHFDGLVRAIHVLTQEDPEFLEKNFELDAADFDLLALKTPQRLKKLVRPKNGAG